MVTSSVRGTGILCSSPGSRRCLGDDPRAGNNRPWGVLLRPLIARASARDLAYRAVTTVSLDYNSSWDTEY